MAVLPLGFTVRKAEIRPRRQIGELIDNKAVLRRKRPFLSESSVGVEAFRGLPAEEMGHGNRDST